MHKYNISQFLGEGWLPVEQEKQSQRQWSWSKEESSLIFPLKHRGYLLEFMGCPSQIFQINVETANKIISSFSVAPTFKINIPTDVVSCRMKVEKLWVPQNILANSEDKRELGVSLQNISDAAYFEDSSLSPETIEMGLTGECNINPPCKMCLARNLEKNQYNFHLSDLIIEKMIPVLENAEVVSLHGGKGEPLLSPRLFEIINKLTMKKIRTEISTNGQLLTEDTAREAVNSGLTRISFSLDAATPITYNKIRNNPGFNKVVNNVRMLARIKKELNSLRPEILMSMVLMNENLPELPEFLNLARILEVPAIVLSLLTPITDNYTIQDNDFIFDYYKQQIDTSSSLFKDTVRIVAEKAKQYGIAIISPERDIRVLLNEGKQEMPGENQINHITPFFQRQ